MFLDTTDNLSFDITTVLKLKWNSRNDNSGIRPYNSLSYRVIGDSLFVHGDTEIKAKTGEVLFVPAYYEYTQICSSEELFVVNFNSNINISDSIKCFRPENTKYFERKFGELYDVWIKKQAGFELECKSIIYKILSKIEYEEAEKQRLSSNDKIHEAVDFIHENFTDNSLNVNDLAKMCNMSDTYFRRLFVENFSLTPIDYIKNLRVNYAKELLQSGYYTVQEVSEKCGFNTVHYFSSFIKKETGKTPRDFKKY